MNKSYVIGVDTGGTNTAFGVVDRRGEILFRASIKTGDYISGEEYINALGDAISELITKNNLSEQIIGIGMGVPNGNIHDGSISMAANIQWAKSGEKILLAQMLTGKTNLPCRLTNDANAAAIGEMIYGVAKGLKDFIFITLGTGLGSGIVAGGQLVIGHDGLAGELGHVRIIRHNGRLCGCGRTGCLETYCSAPGVARTAREFLEINPEKASSLRRITNREITSKDVFDAAQKGDGIAVEIFNFTGTLLGEALCDFIAFSSPKAIILFGGLTHAGDFLLKPLKASLDKNIFSIYRGKTEILVSQLNDAEAAILGAGALAWE
ncbi:MAG: ROK family protein [Dysgonamonadaceae bacterium]|jgi:glucokinase|nr:ROK family protein [Dysgonamonadaceae bacterium]